MTICHYIGFDVHKKSVSYCVKTGDGTIVEGGSGDVRNLQRQLLDRTTRPPSHAPNPGVLELRAAPI
jgi:hypothetical protein